MHSGSSCGRGKQSRTISPSPSQISGGCRRLLSALSRIRDLAGRQRVAPRFAVCPLTWRLTGLEKTDPRLITRGGLRKGRTKRGTSDVVWTAASDGGRSRPRRLCCRRDLRDRYSQLSLQTPRLRPQEECSHAAGSFWVDIAHKVIAHISQRGGQPDFSATIQ